MPSSRTPPTGNHTDREGCHTDISLARSWSCCISNTTREKDRLPRFASSSRYFHDVQNSGPHRPAGTFVPVTVSGPPPFSKHKRVRLYQSANHLHIRVKPPFIVMSGFTVEAGHTCRRENWSGREKTPLSDWCLQNLLPRSPCPQQCPPPSAAHLRLCGVTRTSLAGWQSTKYTV